MPIPYSEITQRPELTMTAATLLHFEKKKWWWRCSDISLKRSIAAWKLEFETFPSKYRSECNCQTNDCRHNHEYNKKMPTKPSAGLYDLAPNNSAPTFGGVRVRFRYRPNLLFLKIEYRDRLSNDTKTVSIARMVVPQSTNATDGGMEW